MNALPPPAMLTNPITKVEEEKETREQVTATVTAGSLADANALLMASVASNEDGFKRTFPEKVRCRLFY